MVIKVSRFKSENTRHRSLVIIRSRLFEDRYQTGEDDSNLLLFFTIRQKKKYNSVSNWSRNVDFIKRSSKERYAKGGCSQIWES